MFYIFYLFIFKSKRLGLNLRAS